MDEASERRLLQAAGEGDGDALRLLYQHRGAELLDYLVGLCRDEQVAQELLQDTMLKAWRHAGSFRGDASVRTWLYVIARRTARDYWRRPHRDVVSDEVLDSVPAPAGEQPESGVLARADTQMLLAAFDRLPPLRREVLVLVALRGFSIREASEVIGVAEGTVKSRLFHARRALAALLAEERHRDEDRYGEVSRERR